MRTTIVVSGSVTARQYEPIRREAVRLGLNPVIVRDDMFVDLEFRGLALRVFDVVEEDFSSLGFAKALGYDTTNEDVPGFISNGIAKHIVGKVLETYGRVYAMVHIDPKETTFIQMITLLDTRTLLRELGQNPRIYFAGAGPNSDKTVEIPEDADPDMILSMDKSMKKPKS
jgi:hypothetical protein